jgi:hypothetical protein
MTWAGPIRLAAEHAARVHGIRVVELAGFTTRGHGPSPGRLLGTMWHDTITPKTWTQTQLFNLLRDGYAGLPGPIANVGLERDGTLGLIAAGRAYHAGSGSWPGIPDGNSNTCGVEAANAGPSEPWTQPQRSVALTFTRELHRIAGLSAATVIGHKEWAPGRKGDPFTVDMRQVRSQFRQVEEDDVAQFSDVEAGRLKQLVKLLEDVNAGSRWAATLITDKRDRDRAGVTRNLDLLGGTLDELDKVKARNHSLAVVLEGWRALSRRLGLDPNRVEDVAERVAAGRADPRLLEQLLDEALNHLEIRRR